MSEYIPTLTLDPNGLGEAAGYPAATAAVAAEAAETASAIPEDPNAVPSQLDMSQLSEAEQKVVEDFSAKIDISDSNAVMQYGAVAQKNIADFSGQTLNAVRTKDMGEVGEMLSDLVVELKGFKYEESEKKGFLGLKKKVSASLENYKAQYAKAEVNVDKITNMLQQHQVVLLKDIALMDKMYEKNQDYFKELTMYILAGKKKLEECRNVNLPELTKKAEESGLPEDAQAVNDYANLINRFEKKLFDLELTRTISVQMSPQIRLIQNNDTLMVEKIQTSIVNTIPLWKSQMVLALGLGHSQQAMEAQREVTELTNELLKKNAAALKTASIDIAKESERGIVDMETLQQTNRDLIDTLEEVQNIQAEGSTKRREAEFQLGRIEDELKQKLLDLKGIKA